MTSGRLYTLVLTMTLAGYAWLGWNLMSIHPSGSTTLCPVRLVSGIPCPSCGTTSGIMSLLHGDIGHAITFNPLSLMMALLMLIVPVWILRDVMIHRDSFFRAYRRTEQFIRQPRIAIPGITLIIANWIWNIIKM